MNINLALFKSLDQNSLQPVRELLKVRGKKESKVVLGKEFQDDMSELKELLDKEDIKYTFIRHEGANPDIKDLIGYYPTGEWHIRVGENSIIRGMVSFGDYEIYNGKIKDDPVRFSTAQEMLKEIKKRLTP
jgi:hypothetical protein